MKEDLMAAYFGKEARPSKAERDDRFFAKYGLPHNPFPPSRTIVREIMHGQEDGMKLFRSLVRDVLTGSHPTRRSMAVLGSTGGGKTHFIRHCQFELEAVLEELNRKFVVVEFASGHGKLMKLVRELYRKCDQLSQDHDEVDFPSELVYALSQSKARDELIKKIEVDDLRRALKKLLELQKIQAEDFEYAVGIFSRWLRGETLTQSEKKKLGVLSRISTTALCIKTCLQLMKVSAILGLFDGICICFDEIETIFTKGLSENQIQSLLQDTRYFYDELIKNETGINAIIVSASTQYGSRQLASRNYPIYQRLSFESNAFQLRGISDAVEAIEFALTYIDHFNEIWKKNNKGAKKTLEARTLLSQKEIRDVFNESGQGKTTVSQGALLDNLYRKAENKRAQTSQDI